MNNVQTNKFKMFKVVVLILNKFAQLVDLVPALRKASDRFKILVDKIEQVYEIQGGNSKGITKGKQLQRDELTDQALIIAGALFSYAADNQNSELKSKMDLIPYDFDKLNETEFQNICNSILTEANLHAADMVEHGIQATDIENYGNEILLFKSAVPTIRGAVVTKSEATAELKELFDEANKIVEEKFDKLIPQFRKRNPDFFTEYFSASHVEKRGHHMPKVAPSPEAPLVK